MKRKLILVFFIQSLLLLVLHLCVLEGQLIDFHFKFLTWNTTVHYLFGLFWVLIYLFLGIKFCLKKQDTKEIFLFSMKSLFIMGSFASGLFITWRDMFTTGKGGLYYTLAMHVVLGFVLLLFFYFSNVILNKIKLEK